VILAGEELIMCLAIPMKIIEIKGDFAEVEAGRLIRTANIQMISHVRKGDYVLVHAGFAIERVDPEKAKATLRLIDEASLETSSKRGKRRFLTG
jgi:hydrogenase expression/formation protein HypC